MQLGWMNVFFTKSGIELGWQYFYPLARHIERLAQRISTPKRLQPHASNLQSIEASNVQGRDAATQLRNKILLSGRQKAQQKATHEARTTTPAGSRLAVTK